MANSASDARGSELEIQKQMLESGAVDVVIAIASNFFYTVTLPCTLWFLSKKKSLDGTAGKVLFLDARDMFHQIDRTHREFKLSQLEFLSNVVRLYRGDKPEVRRGSQRLMDEYFPDSEYRDVIGLCSIATIDEIEEEGWSLNPARYVGFRSDVQDDIDFERELSDLYQQFVSLTSEARELESQVSEAIGQILSKPSKGQEK